MPLNIIRNDISKVKADAIVNTANANVAVGAGVDQAIYEAAGFDELLAERAKIGPMKPGQAAATPAFALDAKYIIHTIGPAWQGGNYHERETVASCYRESLRIADELHCESVAFPLNIIRNDISKVKADAIVNTANANVAVGAGVDQAIYEAAGFDELLAERAKIGPMKPGQAAATPAFALDAKYIIHTIGPAWQGGNYHERETVASCYRESLRIADELHCESVAFPLISTGTFGFPKDEALRIAVNEISSFLFTHDMTVYMVVYDKEAFVISGKAFPDIKEFIEEEDVKPPESSYLRRRRRMQQIASSKLDLPLSYARREDVPASIDMEEEFLPDAATGPELAGPEVGMAELDMAELDMDQPDMDQPELADISYSENVSLPEAYFTGNYEGLDKKLDEIIKRRAKTFQQMLFQWIDRKGMTDPEVYKKANVDRKLFSKIRSKEDYLPSKKTVIAFAIALELNLDQTIDLLRRAGYALSPSSEFDLIIEYCINHKIYNIHKINILLFDRTDQILVGC